MTVYLEREALREEMEGTDWYHINKDGKLTSGASGIEEALYKADDVYGVIYKQPAKADVVEVVRCKECKRFENNKEAYVTYCKKGNGFMPVKPDDFCSYGERKDNDDRTEN